MRGKAAGALRALPCTLHLLCTVPRTCRCERPPRQCRRQPPPPPPLVPPRLAANTLRCTAATDSRRPLIAAACPSLQDINPQKCICSATWRPWRPPWAACRCCAGEQAEFAPLLLLHRLARLATKGLRLLAQLYQAGICTSPAVHATSRPTLATLPAARHCDTCRWAGVSSQLWSRAQSAARLRPVPTKPSDNEGLLVVGSSENMAGCVQVRKGGSRGKPDRVRALSRAPFCLNCTEAVACHMLITPCCRCACSPPVAALTAFLPRCRLLPQTFSSDTIEWYSVSTVAADPPGFGTITTVAAPAAHTGRAHC